MEENGRIDMSRPTVEMKNIVKMFGSFKANDGINLTVHKGEIHAILGENGAGKSSLINCIAGEERSIVSDIAGTTRDAIDTAIEREGVKYNFIDTAGLRRKNRYAALGERVGIN